jgi:hypothetical protein
VEEEDAASTVGQVPKATVTGREEVQKEVLGAQINNGVCRWREGEDWIVARRTRPVFTLLDAVVAGDDRARVLITEEPEEAAVSDDAAPTLARARRTDEVERRGEAQEY